MPAVVSFGINTCFAVKRWPEAEEWTAIVADLGLEQVQFSFDLLDPIIDGSLARFDRIRAVCEQREISVSLRRGAPGRTGARRLHRSDERARVRGQRPAGAIDSTDEGGRPPALRARGARTGGRHGDGA